MTSEIFAYPTGHGVLRSVDEYKKLFLPELYDLERVVPRMKRTIELAKQCASSDPGQKWLDYGAGGGVFVYHFAEKAPNWNVTGWESDFSSFEIADKLFSRENTAYERRGFDAYRELKSESWDGITMLEVIEHVDNAGEILSAFHSALNPNGLLVISTPNFSGWSNVRMEARRRFNQAIGRRNEAGYVGLINSEPYDPATDSGHISTHSVWTLATLMRKHGFTIETYAYTPLNNSIASRVFPDTLIVVGRKNS